MHELDKGVVLQFARMEVAVYNFFVKKQKVIFFILRARADGVFAQRQLSLYLKLAAATKPLSKPLLTRVGVLSKG